METLVLIFLVLFAMSLVLSYITDVSYRVEMKNRNILEQERNQILRSQHQFSLKRWEETKELKRGNTLSMKKTPLQELPNVPRKPLSDVWAPYGIGRDKNQ